MGGDVYIEQYAPTKCVTLQSVARVPADARGRIRESMETSYIHTNTQTQAQTHTHTHRESERETSTPVRDVDCGVNGNSVRGTR